MQTINIIDPQSGQAHAIPYDKLPDALKSGGQFADEEQKTRAMKLQKNNYGESGLLEEGNINLNNRPKVPNPETGGESTVWSMSIGTPRGEVLIPRVSDEGKILTPQEAQDQFRKTGKHLGIFDNPEKATKYAKQLHKQQENQYIRNQPKERTGLLGVVGDVAEGLNNAKNFAFDIPNKLEKSGKYIEENPTSSILHNAGQLAAGAAETGKSLVNAPHDLLKYFIKKHLALDLPIPGTKMHTSDLIPHIPEDTGLEKALGLQPDKEKGDDLIRAVPDLVLGGKGIASGIGKVKKFATAPSKTKLFQRELEEKVSNAAEKVGMSKEKLKKLQEALKLEYSATHGETLGEANPVALQEKINVMQHKLAEKKPLTEIPEREVGEIPPAPDTKAMLEKHQTAIDEAKAAAEEHIGIKKNPSLKAGEKVQKAMTDLEKSSTDIYDAARDYYKDKNVSADNSAEIKAATEELEALKASDELAPGYGSGTAEQKALEQNIEALKGEKVQASDVFSLMRTMQQMANKTRMKRKGATQLEWERLTKIADNLDSHADKLAKRLENVGGQDVQKMIKQANKGYRTFKQLSRENPIGKAAMKGNVPSNALIKLAEDHPANEFLKSLVDSDPELRKHLLAAYAGESNVNKLTKPSTLVNDYIKSLPEVEERLNAFKNAVADYKPAERNANRVKAEHDALVKSMEDAAKEQKTRRDAIAESDKLEKQIQFKKDAIPKIEARMKKLDASTAEHKALQKQLDEHKKFVQDKGGRLKELAHFLVKFKIAKKLHL